MIGIQKKVSSLYKKYRLPTLCVAFAYLNLTLISIFPKRECYHKFGPHTGAALDGNIAAVKRDDLLCNVLFALSYQSQIATSAIKRRFPF